MPPMDNSNCSAISLTVIVGCPLIISMTLTTVSVSCVSVLVLVSVLVILFRYIFTLKSPSKSINSGLVDTPHA